jgi:hypothetical protein
MTVLTRASSNLTDISTYIILQDGKETGEAIHVGLSIDASWQLY